MLSSVPIAPLSRRALSAWKLGSKRRLNASSNLAPDRAEAAARARAGSWSIGFSQKIALPAAAARTRSEEHTSELQSLMRISYAVFCLKKTKKNTPQTHHDE